MNTLQLQRTRKSYLNGPLVTVVMDGVGLSDFHDDNALHLANTPTLDSIFQQYEITPLTVCLFHPQVSVQHRHSIFCLH